MGSNRKSFALLLVLLFTMSLVLLLSFTVKAQTRTLVVPDQYSTIQDAISNSNIGDTVFVKHGIYNETLVIDKAISLVGENENSTIIDAKQVHSQVILIESSNVIVANFTLGNSGYTPPTNSGWEQQNGEGDGIRIISLFPYSQNITVTNNTIVSCPLWGIDIGISFYDNVSSNLIIGTGLGIQAGCLNSTIKNNILANSSIELKTKFEVIGEQTYDVNKSDNIQGNQNITLATIPTPFPSISPRPAPSTTLLLVTVSTLIVIAVLLAVNVILLLRRHRNAKLAV